MPYIFRQFAEQSLLCQTIWWCAWDGWGTGWDPVSHLTYMGLSDEEAQGFRRERLPCNPLSCTDSPGCASLSTAHVLNRKTYSTCKCILRCLTVSSSLWLWKQLYLNTACKLVFQNKSIIKARRKGGRISNIHVLQRKYSFLGVLWIQTVQGAKYATAVQWTWCAGTFQSVAQQLW